MQQVITITLTEMLETWLFWDYADLDIVNIKEIVWFNFLLL